MRNYLLLLLACLLVMLPAAAQDATPEIEYPTSGEVYSLMTFPVEVDPATYTNPFNSADIEVLGVFVAPSGKQQVIPGFWMQPYENTCAECEREDWQPIGDPGWRIRFTPQEIGTWTYRLQAQDGDTLVFVETGSFDVSASEKPGFIRVGANQRYFQRQNGEPYFPVGHNLKWSWDEIGGVRTYIEWLRQLSAAGGNYARLYIDTPWFIGLEWNEPVGDYRAAQKSAAQLDMILDAAADYGVALQIVILWHQALMIYNSAPVNIPTNFPRVDASADWDNNPYNIIYGGPIGGPSLFFSDRTAIALFRQRMRYIVARWGYSPDIFAWEIIDEIDRTSGYESSLASAWLQDTASYLKQIDQHGHLVTAGSRTFDTAVAANPLLDFTTGQFYQRRPIETVIDQTTGIVDLTRRLLTTSPVPTLLTAYSLNPWFEPTADDPQGIHVQDTLWASALAGGGGAAASDWSDTYLIPQGLQTYYRPLRAFTSGVDWPNLNFEYADASLISSESGTYQPIRVSGFDRRFATPALEDIFARTLTPDGLFPSVSTVPSYLYGQVYNTQLNRLQVYTVTVPVNTYLEARVRRVSTQAGARLNVTIDGVNAADLELSIGSTNVALRVPLVAGTHEIILDNLGDDWLELEYLEIGHLVSPARSLTLRDSATGVALAWLQHRDYTWEKVAAGVERQAVNFQYQLDRMPPGRYSVEIWNPLTGEVIGEERVRADANGRLIVELPPLDSQLALRIFRQPDPPAATPSPEVTAEATEAPFVVQTNTPRP